MWRREGEGGQVEFEWAAAANPIRVRSGLGKETAMQELVAGADKTKTKTQDPVGDRAK